LAHDSRVGEEVESAGAIRFGGDNNLPVRVAEVGEVGDGRIDGKGMGAIVGGEGEGDLVAAEAELDGDLLPLALDGLEGDGAVLAEDAGGGIEEEVTFGGEPGKRGEAEADGGGIGTGGDVEIVLELGAIGFVEEVDAGVDAIETDGGEVGDLGDVGLTVEVVGDAGERLGARYLRGGGRAYQFHADEGAAGQGGGDGTIMDEYGEVSSGGEEADISRGLATVGFEVERRLVRGGGSREEGRGEGPDSQEESHT